MRSSIVFSRLAASGRAASRDSGVTSSAPSAPSTPSAPPVIPPPALNPEPALAPVLPLSVLSVSGAAICWPLLLLPRRSEPLNRSFPPIETRITLDWRSAYFTPSCWSLLCSPAVVMPLIPRLPTRLALLPFAVRPSIVRFTKPLPSLSPVPLARESPNATILITPSVAAAGAAVSCGKVVSKASPLGYKISFTA
ncbi:hypothetical protein D3C75_882680 [compost metagenome]